MTSPRERFRPRAAQRRPQPVQPSGESTPFASFLERHEERTRKSRNKRRMFVISVAVHVVVFGLLILLSAWKVEELFGPSVEVKVMSGALEDTGDGKRKMGPRTNVGRAVGLRLVVTPQGARSEPRSDLEPAPFEVRTQLESLVNERLLPALTYPAAAQSLRLRGAVTVLVDVDEDGQAATVEVKDPCLHPLLCQAARDAVAKVERWPAPAEGASRLAVPIDFRVN